MTATAGGEIESTLDHIVDAAVEWMKEKRP
jgi:hypothetical protein